MSFHPVSTPASLTVDDRHCPEHATFVRLDGRWLTLARVGWLSVVATVIAIFVASLPVYYDELRTLAGSTISDPAAMRAGLDQMGLSTGAYAAYVLTLEIAFVGSFVTVALLIASRKFDDGMSLFVSLTLITFGATFSRAPQALVASHPSWNIAVNLLSLLGFAAFFTCFYLFPDGRFVPGWTRFLVIPWTIEEVDHYFFPTVFAVDAMMFVLYLALIGTCIYAQIHRYRTVSTTTQRQQTKWVTAGLVAWVVAFLGYGFSGELVQTGTQQVLRELILGTIMAGVLISIPLSIGVAVLRYRLFDIDIIINRALVYGTLSASVIAVYVVIVGYLGNMLRTGGNLAISLVAAGIVAVMFQPLRERLQRGVNHLMYGERDEPYTVLSRLGQRLETTLLPEAILPAAVQTVAEALKLPYAAIELRRGDSYEIAAASGSPRTDQLQIPLLHQGELIGRLSLSPRDAGDTFATSDHRLLDDLARQIGIAAHAVRLADELQRSRERLVTTREEERRRLRRDLHDGLGPQLASVTMKAEAARDLLTSDPVQAEALMTDVVSHAQSAVADVRRVVYALRPPALDALGLIGTLRAHTSQFDHAGLRIDVDAVDNLPPLPAAVEVAAYRIALEALNNVARHAKATACTIRVNVNERESALLLEIQDNGQGINTTSRPGVGLSSMRERTSELGGSISIQAHPDGGTCVRVSLPLNDPLLED